MSISHANVYSTNETQNIVPLSAIQYFSPKNENDFNKTKKYKVWLKNSQDEKNDVLLNAYILLLGSKKFNLIFILFYRIQFLISF